jgi:hypothetical protein
VVTARTSTLGFESTLEVSDSLLAPMEAVARQLVFIQALVQLVNAVAALRHPLGPISSRPRCADS